MPPSPALRYSPGREPKAKNHKRGRSLEATKLRQFSDFKLGISIPVRGESSELLNADGEKNDYDWLLTPPDTPLFPSLDDEPPPANVASRGRPRSQPITISRSSTMEKSYRSSRGSASPNRLSPSPRSANSSIQSREGRHQHLILAQLLANDLPLHHVDLLLPK
ncbi:hypothetical protein GH714_017532 [Hevea brasiliensis]|uniref:Uncharacterized protein n=1 Tax=Hevea brasiliensis TaxID=3981 RepID=A0A6A6KC79_HEVBR|nr:hypothetical protein GH714_017532 [Hevea brasiliensis]